MKRFCHFGIIVVACIAGVLTSSCESRNASAFQHLVGKTEADVIKELGPPAVRADYDSPLMDPETHSRQEVDKFNATTPSVHFEYKNIIVKFNLNGTVYLVEDKGP